jgi:hypothetical protein
MKRQTIKDIPMKKIYLGLPYSCKYKQVRERRVKVARRIAKLLILQSYVITCPVLQAHGLGLPTDWEFWEAHDTVFLEWCEELWIIMLPGWKESDGVQSEIKIAKILGKKTVYLEPNHE